MHGKSLNTIQRTYDFIRTHPLGKRHTLRARKSWLGWQLRSRLSPGSLVVPFVGETKLLVHRGMHGATGNINCGLHEFEDMAFLMHYLRPGDLFVDVGANIGSYTVLASGQCRARTIAIEPVAHAADILWANVELNSLQALVRLERCIARNCSCECRPGLHEPRTGRRRAVAWSGDALFQPRRTVVWRSTSAAKDRCRGIRTCGLAGCSEHSQ